MADQTIRAWATELQVPLDLLIDTLSKAEWAKTSPDDTVTEEEQSKAKRLIIKARLAAKKGGHALAAAKAAAKPEEAPPATVKPSVPEKAPAPVQPPVSTAKPTEGNQEFAQLQKRWAVTKAKEAKELEQKRAHARAEAEKRALERAKVLAQEVKAEAPAPAAPPAQSAAPKRSGNYSRPQQRPVRRKRASKVGADRGQQQAQKKQGASTEPAPFQPKTIEIPEIIQVADLAHRMSVKSGVVIKTLLDMGVVATATQNIEQETAELVVVELGHNATTVNDRAAETKLETYLNQESAVVTRAPVVTIMGHVDHGKTTLLDYIRKSKVADSEAGGITQHIGAYQVETDRGPITFIDTPGHEAFSSLRARGAKATDLIILVVAADDGVKPQTIEAIQHAQTADVPIVVALNKIDRARSDIEKIKEQLASNGVQVEGWGGEVQAVPISAKTGKGIPDLLEAVQLEAEIRELRASVTGPARGLVLEAQLKPGYGAAATLLVQSGTLKVADNILVDAQEVRVRAMASFDGTRLKEAIPSTPVEITGFSAVPDVGLAFCAVADARLRREVLEYRARIANSRRNIKAKVGLDALFSSQPDLKELNLVVKADVRGSLESIQSALMRLGNDRVKVQIVSSGVGGIGESDINLAHAVHGLVIGFNTRADNSAKKAAREMAIEVRYYSTIYALIEDIELALSGMLEPELREEIIGKAQVKEVFTSSSFGLIAGSVVVEGVVKRDEPIRVLRDNVVVFEGSLSSLRRYKNDVDEINEGVECGIGVRDYKDVRVGDYIEVFSVREVQAELRRSE